MGNRWNRRSRNLETPSPDRDLGETQVDTPNQGNETSTNVDTIIQDTFEDELRSQLTEPSQISIEIQVGTEIIEKKNNDKILKMEERTTDSKQF